MYAIRSYYDYEFLVNGVHKNPRTVTLPQAEPLRGERLADFRLRAESP